MTTVRDPDLYVLRAEARAVEEGHQARRVADWKYLVKSDSVPGRTYTVRVFWRPELKIQCNCPAGTTFGVRLVVGCKHGALVARRLEREGVLVWDRGTWRPAVELTPMAPSVPGDPFEGITRSEVA